MRNVIGIVCDVRPKVKAPKIIWKFEILAQKSVSANATVTACALDKHLRSRGLRHVATLDLAFTVLLDVHCFKFLHN
jgi:hypothetical protein